MIIELKRSGFIVQQQHPIPVLYDGEVVGDYYADIIVNGKILLKLNAIKAFDEVHEAQCLNYLKATGLPICLLLNFRQTRLGIRRFAGLANESAPID